MKNALTVLNNSNLTMTSREIASLSGRDHKNVMRDIRAMISELHGEGGLLSFEQAYIDPQNGQTYPEFKLPKRETLILVSGYSVVMRAAIIDRWQELEASNDINFNNPAIAARAWADMYEAKLLADATKAEIGSRREATAMNTASTAVKRANRLEIELDRSHEFATIKRMELQYHGIKFDWRILKQVASDINLQPMDVFDQNYGTVKAYHADVWREAYALAL